MDLHGIHLVKGKLVDNLIFRQEFFDKLKVEDIDIDIVIRNIGEILD